jgi:hypothetical protein
MRHFITQGWRAVLSPCCHLLGLRFGLASKVFLFVPILQDFMADAAGQD